MGFRPAAWWASDRRREMRRSVAWGDRRASMSFRPAASMSFRPTVSMSFRPAASMSFRSATWWESDRRREAAWGVRREVIGVRWSAAWGNRRWERSLLERERDERVTGEIFSKKKGWGDEESDWERDWGRWEMSENAYYFINRSNKKFNFFFCYQLQYTSIYRCVL